MADKQAALAEWAAARGFVPTRDFPHYWEVAYGHTVGYGYITIRVSGTSVFGFDLIVESGHGDDRHGINLGACSTLDQLGDLVDRLCQLEYDIGPYNRVPPSRPLKVDCPRG